MGIDEKINEIQKTAQEIERLKKITKIHKYAIYIMGAALIGLGALAAYEYFKPETAKTEQKSKEDIYVKKYYKID